MGESSKRIVGSGGNRSSTRSSASHAISKNRLQYEGSTLTANGKTADRISKNSNKSRLNSNRNHKNNQHKSGSTTSSSSVKFDSGFSECSGPNKNGNTKKAVNKLGPVFSSCGDRSIQSNHSTSVSSRDSDSSNSADTATATILEYDSLGDSEQKKNDNISVIKNPKTLKQIHAVSSELAKAFGEIKVDNQRSVLESAATTSSYRMVSWNELITLSLIVIALSCMSILTGIAAGVTLTLHQYENYQQQQSLLGNVVVLVDNNNSIRTSFGQSNSAETAPWYDSAQLQQQYKQHSTPSLTSRVSQYLSGQQYDPTMIGPRLTESSAYGIPMRNEKMSSTIPLSEQGSPPLKAILKVNNSFLSLPNANVTTKTTDRQMNKINETSDDNGYWHHMQNTERSDSWLKSYFGNDTIRTPVHNPLLSSTSSLCKLPSPPSERFFGWNAIRPVLCSDGKTVGYNSWLALQAAIDEANYFSAERFVRWRHFEEESSRILTSCPSSGDWSSSTYNNRHSNKFEDPSLYYEEEIVFTICPGTTLKSFPVVKDRHNYNHQFNRQRRRIQKRSSSVLTTPQLYVNAENVLIECGGDSRDCYFDISETGGAHLSFGSMATNVRVTGITFIGATTDNLQFYDDGADVEIEDCIFYQGTERSRDYHRRRILSKSPTKKKRDCTACRMSSTTSRPRSNSRSKNKKDDTYKWDTSSSVAHIPSASTANFYRCYIIDEDGPKTGRYNFGRFISNLLMM